MRGYLGCEDPTGPRIAGEMELALRPTAGRFDYRLCPIVNLEPRVIDENVNRAISDSRSGAGTVELLRPPRQGRVIGYQNA